MLACWPGKIRPGSISNEIVCHVDLMATVAAILGTKLPDNAGEDSYNILPALLGQPRDRPIREATVHHSCNGHFAIRKGPWVLIDYTTGGDNREPEWFRQERELKELLEKYKREGRSTPGKPQKSAATDMPGKTDITSWSAQNTIGGE
jgi:arylsulfatase A-like enzyme